MISISKKWRILKGYGFGLHYPVMLGEIIFPPDLQFKLHWQQDAFGRLLGKHAPLPEPFKAPTNTRDVAEWLLQWAHHVQQVFKIALSEKAIAGELTRSQTELKFEVIAPYYHPHATLESIKWVVGTASAVSAVKSRSEMDVALSEAARKLSMLKNKMHYFATVGININHMLPVAVKHGIPFRSLTNSIYTFGQGRKSRWIASTFTDKTSYIGSTIAANKDTASIALAQHGVPVAEHFLVDNEKDAVRYAMKLGYPVVVKPADLEGGVGVHAGLTSEEQVRSCFRDAASHSKKILIEKFHEGRDYRITILHGRMVKAIERTPGGVTGDGQHTVAALLSLGQSSAESLKRSGERGKALLTLDREAHELLHEAGLSPDAVPGAGHFIKLRRRANVSSGGTTSLVMDKVHPHNRALAERAAEALRLDVAGIDMIIADISTSWLESGAIICEVNAQPQLGSNNISGLYSQFIFSLLDGNGRIPVTLLVSDRQYENHMPNWIGAFTHGVHGSVVVHDGVMFLDGERMSRDRQGFSELVVAAQNCRQAERILIVVSPDELYQHGLPAAVIDTLVLLPCNLDETNHTALAQWYARMMAPGVRGHLLLSSRDAIGELLIKSVPRQRYSELSEETISIQVAEFLTEHRDQLSTDVSTRID